MSRLGRMACGCGSCGYLGMRRIGVCHYDGRGERTRRVLNRTCQSSTSVCRLTLRNRLSISAKELDEVE